MSTPAAEGGSLPSGVVLRTATAADLPGMSRIYDAAVADSVATFDVEPQGPGHYAERVASTRPGDHVVVAVRGEHLLGMAYAATYRPRPAYDGTREVSVYVDGAARGIGLGRALYDELLARVDADGIHTCLAVIALPNAPSEALHRAVGFEHVGTLREVGRKFGRWVDTAWYQRVGPGAPAP